MDNFANIQTALNQYNLLHTRFTVLVEHFQEHPEFQMPALNWRKLDHALIELDFLNFHVRLHFEIVKHKGRILGRMAIEKAHRGGEFRDLGRPIYFNSDGQTWLGSPTGTQLNIEDDIDPIAAYVFGPLVPQEGAAATSE